MNNTREVIKGLTWRKRSYRQRPQRQVKDPTGEPFRRGIRPYLLIVRCSIESATVSDERVQFAAENNARWCDAVCRAHGLSCEFTAGAWVMRGTPPPYYSNFVTIRAGEAVSQQQQGLIREIVTSEPGRSFGFKDSFCCIDSVEAGGGRQFDVLFEATWIWSDVARAGPRNTAMRWSRVQLG